MTSLPRLFFALTLGAALLLVGSGPSVADAQRGGPQRGASQRGASGQGARARRGQGAHRGRRAQRRQHRRRGQMRRVMNELNLSDAQREQMHTLRREGRGQGRALRGAGDREARRAHRREMRSRMQNVLTSQQRARLQELHAQRGRARLDRRVARLTERLSLTSAQAAQVRGVLNHARTQRRAIREQARMDQRPPRDAMRALRTQTRAQMSTILSEEQLRLMRTERPGRGQRGRRGRGAQRGR